MGDQLSQNQGRQSRTNTGLSAVDKHTFIMLFQKDIQKLYIYKKCVKVARAIYIISPAFKDTDILRERLENIAMSLIDSGTHMKSDAHVRLGSELLTLQTVITVAVDSRRLSEMNGDIILGEIEMLMEEMSIYTEPRISLPEVPSLSKLSALANESKRELRDHKLGVDTMRNPFGTTSLSREQKRPPFGKPLALPEFDLPHHNFEESREGMSLKDRVLKDFDMDEFEKTLKQSFPNASKPRSQQEVKAKTTETSKPKPESISSGGADRRSAIMDILKSKGPSTIKDISVLFTDVSEKTIQRELAVLVLNGQITKTGDRRWTQYAIK